MSVFGRFKRGRMAAKEYKAELAEKQKAEEKKPAYRHVPTHAAVDALAGAPSSWRDDDRARVIAENKRRSAMRASTLGHETLPHRPGQNPVHVGMPRTNSSLSHVSYPSVHANPMVSLPRAHSYNGSIHPPWGGRNGAVTPSSLQEYRHSTAANLTTSSTGKGKSAERIVAGSSGRGSQLYSKSSSLVGSSSDTSSDELEMKSVRRRQAAPESQGTGENNSSSLQLPTEETKPVVNRAHKPESHAHRLHPSKTGKHAGPPNTSRHRYYPPRAGQSFRSTPHRSGSSPKLAPMPSIVPSVPSMPLKSLELSPKSYAASLSSMSRRTSSASSGTAHSGPGRPGPRTGGYIESPTSPVTPDFSVPASPATPHTSEKASEFEFDFLTTYTTSDLGSYQKPRAFSLTPEIPSVTTADEALEPSLYNLQQATPPAQSAQNRSRDSRTVPVELNEATVSHIPREVPAPQPQSPPSSPQKVGRGKLTKQPQAAKPAKATRGWPFGKS